jgi:hypothetical protein
VKKSEGGDDVDLSFLKELEEEDQQHQQQGESGQKKSK